MTRVGVSADLDAGSSAATAAELPDSKGRAEELAEFVPYALSPRASYRSGTDVLVDGGQAAGMAAVGGLAALMSRG